MFKQKNSMDLVIRFGPRRKQFRGQPVKRIEDMGAGGQNLKKQL
jgi:hypothetical protein